MFATHLTQFLKDIFELLERRNADLDKSDENIMSHFVGFVMNVFKNSVSTVDVVQLSEAFRASFVKDLLAICGDILKLISHLSTEVKSAGYQQKLEIDNLKNKPIIGNFFTSNLFSNHSTQLDDYYCNFGDFESFNEVQEFDARLAYFEKPVLKNEDLEKIQRIINHTEYSKTETTNNLTAGRISNVSNVETSKKELVNFVNTGKSLPEKSMKTEKTLLNDARGTVSVPYTSSENPTKSGITEDQLEHCTVNHITVRNVNTLDNLHEKDTSHSTRYISILHLNNLAVINTSFAIDKMGLNSTIKEGTQYICLLCSVHTAAKVEDLNDHLQLPLHMDKLAKDIIWVSSLGTCVNTVGISLYQCCICSNTGDITEMNKHFKSKTHKRSFRSATTACSSILEAMEHAAQNKETQMLENTQTLTSNFEMVLHQHKIKLLGKQLSCNNCSGIEIPMSLHNLYTHITGQQHWCSYFLHIKKRFINMPKISSGVDQTYRGFVTVYDSKDKCFCQICKIFIDGVSIKKINSHIKSDAHYIFLMLFLKNEKVSTFVDLNEGGQEDSKELSLPIAGQGKLESNTSKVKLETNMNQKTKIGESTFVHVAGSHVIFNYNIAIDKYSWNGMKMYKSMYICEPCGVAVPVTDCSVHVVGDSHKTRLDSCPLNMKPLTRKMENNTSLFCLVCGDGVQEEIIADHCLTEHHKAQTEQLTLMFENWKRDMNRNFAKVFFPTSSEVYCDTVIDILEQNELIVLNRSCSYKVFCKLCSLHLLVRNLEELYEHITCTSHFSAFVQSMNMNWIMIEPKYVNGVMTSTEDNEISFCLVCNFTLLSETAADHQTSGVHKRILPIFIEHIFSHHCLMHVRDAVVCSICEKTLCDKSLCFLNVCKHVKGSVHVNKHEPILMKVFSDISGEIDKMSLDYLKSGIQRFRRCNISYCSTCNIFFKGASDTSVFEHTHSQIHYVFEYVFPKKLKKKK